MQTLKNFLLGPILRYAEDLRFPELFLVTLALFVVDLFVPDFIPFVDEILLGLVTLLFANLKNEEKDRD